MNEIKNVVVVVVVLETSLPSKDANTSKQPMIKCDFVPLADSSNAS